MTRLNVYDSVNRERLLGTHPRWSGPHENYRFACYRQLGPVTSTMRDGWLTDEITIDHVDLQRIVKVSKDGWEAEVCFVTYSGLKDLMCLSDFRLPGEGDYEHRKRHERW